MAYDSGEPEVFLRGVGLPGLAMQAESYQIHNLKALASDAFQATGRSLDRASQLYDSALTIPIFRSRTLFTESAWNIDRTAHGYHIMGVIVVYLGSHVRESAALRSYLHEVFASIPTLSTLMVQRFQYVHRNSKRARTNLRVLIIAVRFTLRLMRSKGTKVAVVKTKEPKKEGRRFRLMRATGKVGVIVAWLEDYFAKFNGGEVLLPKRMGASECLNTWLGGFLSIAFTVLLFDKWNEYAVLDNTESLFFLPPSFGALATILYGLPASPLAQPRIVLLAHLYTCTVAVVVGYIFVHSQEDLLWLQLALTGAFAITGMGAFGYVLIILIPSSLRHLQNF